MRRGSGATWPKAPASLGVQQFLAGAGSSPLLLACAGLWLLEQRSGLAPALVWLMRLGAAALIFDAARRRHSAPPSARLGRLDYELACAALLGLLMVTAAAPGGLRGPFSGLLYVGFAVLAALAHPVTVLWSWLSLLGLLAARSALARGGSPWDHAPLLAGVGLAGAAGALGLRRKLERAQKGVREELERELENLREEARSYRLTQVSPEIASSPRSAPLEPAPGRLPDDESPLLRASIDEIHAALKSTLGLCRIALGCRSVLLLWLDDSESRLSVRAAASREPRLISGPFSAKEGLFAAALESDRLVELTGAPAQRPLPYYPAGPRAGHVALLPLEDDGRRVGLLSLDRDHERPLSHHELEILAEAARLCLRTIDNERVLVSLSRAKLTQGRLYRAVERLNEARTELQVIETGVGSAADFAAFQFAAVTLLRSDGAHEICAVSGEGADDLVGQSFRDASGLVGMVVQNRHPLPYRGQCGPDVQVLFSRALPAPKLPSLLVLPLLVHEQVLGTLVLGSEKRGGFEADVSLSLQVLAGHIAVSLANARMMKRLEELATTDGLTGLLNKRAATELGRQKLRAAQRFKKPLSVLVCDLDHFKRVNDSHGHDVGDRVIRGFAEVLARAKRETDVVGRFGGEEFVLVCEQTDVQGAQLLAERIRSELRATTFVTPLGPLQNTCSIGVATFPDGGRDWEELFKAADEALYASKRGGRDRVTVWSQRLRATKAAG